MGSLDYAQGTAVPSPTSPAVGNCWTVSAPTYCRLGGIVQGISVPTGEVAVTSFAGADPTGLTDSTAAFNAALSSGKAVFVPCGTYKLNGTVRASNFSLRGAGSCVFLKPWNISAPVMTVSGSNFSRIADLSFFASGGTSDGLKLTSAASNILVHNVHFDGFSGGAGLNCAMTSGAESSGVYVSGGYALGNGTGYQLTFCNDFKIVEAQIGKNRIHGIHLDHSSAGIVARTFIWENGQGIAAAVSNYNYIQDNRITQSGTHGVNWTMGDVLNIQNNQFYQNSSAAAGAASDMRLMGVTNSVVTANTFYDWTAVARTNYALTLGGASSKVGITGNSFSIYNTSGATNVDPSAVSITLANNTPTSTNGTNWSPITSIPLFTPTLGVGGTTSTVYLSTISGVTNHAVPSPAAGLLGCMSINASASPAVGETWTYVVWRNGSASKLSATQANGTFAASICDRTTAVATTPADNVAVRVSTDGATNLGGVSFRGSLTLYQ